MTTTEILEAAKKSIVECNADKAKDAARQGLDEGIDPIELLDGGFVPGINEVGYLFGLGKLFLPELVLSSEVMRSVTAIINEAFPENLGIGKGKIVLGTAQGDIHDIGKTIVASLFQANGFEVYDLGRDIPVYDFIEKAEEVGADIIGMSALLTTTMGMQKRLEQELKKEGLKGKYKTMVGGAPVTQRWADRIGADAFAEDAADGVQKAVELLKK